MVHSFFHNYEQSRYMFSIYLHVLTTFLLFLWGTELIWMRGTDKENTCLTQHSTLRKINSPFIPHKVLHCAWLLRWKSFLEYSGPVVAHETAEVCHHWKHRCMYQFHPQHPWKWQERNYFFHFKGLETHYFSLNSNSKYNNDNTRLSVAGIVSLC